MTDGLNSRWKEWSRPPEPHPPDAGCWCSRTKRRPYVSLIWCSTPSGHGNGLRPWIRNNDRRTAHEPLNLPLDCEHAHVSRSFALRHSITSSARASSDCGTVRPSALAVLRLMTSSNLVGCCTGRSAGLAINRTQRHHGRRRSAAPITVSRRTDFLEDNRMLCRRRWQAPRAFRSATGRCSVQYALRSRANPATKGN